jgi:hypothetical protein
MPEMTRNFPIRFRRDNMTGGTTSIQITPSFEMLDYENKADALIAQAQQYVNKSYEIGYAVAKAQFIEKYPEVECLS